MEKRLWNYFVKVRNDSPLVHNITNYVVMNNTANALLAAGASPVMAHAHAEMKDMMSIANALVINIGTLDEYWTKSMMLAVQHAEAMGRPWILDPVGAGATSYRNQVLSELITRFHPSVIRGNASEIMSLAKTKASTKGVDSLHEADDALEAAFTLTKLTGAVVCISGAKDHVIQAERHMILQNGHPLMAKITGMGCTATALTAAFCGASPDNLFEATAAAMAVMGVAGELAAAKANGPGSLQMHFLDVLYNLKQEEFEQTLACSHEG